MTSPAKSQLHVRQLCNQIIHSYVFSLGVSRSGNWTYIYIASDNSRRRTLYEIRASAVIRLFELFGRNYPSKIKVVFQEQSNDVDVQDV
jgi:hypothetical protein